MKTKVVRAPAVAGMFYPSRADSLRSDVASYIAHGRKTAGSIKPKALIAPHAGYAYSGPIAGSAYACLSRMADEITRVVLLGPSHRVAFSGIARSGAEAFETPLGDVPLDNGSDATLAAFDFVIVNDRAHRDEHSLEVHLPFLQCALKSFELVPLVVGNTSPESVHDVMEKLWGGRETLIVVSTDLSHYLPYDHARRVDEVTTIAIEKLSPEKIHFDQACGALAVQGLLLSARKHGLKATTVDLRNSGDTAGDKNAVVGYGAYAFA